MTDEAEKIERKKLQRYRHRSCYPHFITLQTRWSDNDQYGHVNNARYLDYADMAANYFLISKCKLDPLSTDQPIALAVRTIANFFASVSFPDVLDLGVVVIKLGTSSVTYRVGIFIKEDEQSKGKHPLACCLVDFTHVYVDPHTRKSVRMPEFAREPLAAIYRPIEEKSKL